MTRTKHQQRNHVQRFRLSCRVMRAWRIAASTNAPKTERFAIALMKAVDAMNYKPYKMPKQKNYATRRV